MTTQQQQRDAFLRSDQVNHYRIILALGLLLMGICGAGVFFCYKLPMMFVDELLSGLDCPDGQASPEVNLERLVRGKFPSSVSNVESFQAGGRTKYCEAYLRFEINPADLDSFIASTRIPLPLTSVTTLQHFSSLHGKNPWKPASTTVYLYGISPNTHDYAQTVYVDKINPKRYVVYFVVEYEYLS